MCDKGMTMAAERGNSRTRCRLCCRKDNNGSLRPPSLPPPTSPNMAQQRRTAFPHTSTRRGSHDQTSKTFLTSTMCPRADGVSRLAKRTSILLMTMLMVLNPSQLLQPALAFVQPLRPVVVGKGRLPSRSTSSVSKVILMTERRGLWPTRPPIDLRSDTVTVPTAGMRKAMHKAEVGDDVLGEDPTVKKLEAETAEILGKEAALFVPSGTMANLICHLVWCSQRGSEMILGDQSHSFLWEQANAAQFGGIGYRPLPNQPDGTIDLNHMEAAIRGNNPCFPVSRLVSIENTHAQCGGKVLPMDYLDDLTALAQEEGLRVHMDGARLWNAAAATRRSPASIVSGVDSVSVCYSKGLGAPVGSAVVGSADFISRAHRVRKALGGGMRQSGVVAAAAMEGLRKQLPRLSDDHANARRLAQGLEDLGVPNAVGVDPASVQTNVVLAHIGPDLTDSEVGMSASAVCDRLREKGVLAMATMPGTIRFVTHSQVSTQDIQRAVCMMKEVLEEVGIQDVGLRRGAPPPPAIPEGTSDLPADTTDISQQQQQQQSAVPSSSAEQEARGTNNGKHMANDQLNGSLSEGTIGARREFTQELESTGGTAGDGVTTVAGTAASLRDGGGEGADPDPLRTKTPAVYDDELDTPDGGVERIDGEEEEEEEEESQYKHSFEEVELLGMTVSNEGFVAVMTSKSSGRGLRLIMTPDDPMSGGLDVEDAETSEARTLQQLMQGIDVARHLKSDALGSLMSYPMNSGITLSTVCVVDAVPFSATLTAKIPRRDGDTSAPSSPTSFPYTAPTDATPTQVYASGDTAATGTAAYDDESSVGTVAASAAAGDQSNLAEQNGAPSGPPVSLVAGGAINGAGGVVGGEASAVGAGIGEGVPDVGAAAAEGVGGAGEVVATSRPRVTVTKDAESRSPFETFGLALRYPATRIYVRKELLAPGGGIGDSAMTFDAGDVPELYPTLTRLADARTRKSPADEMDAQFEVSRIRQQLENAMKQGDPDRISSLREKLNALVVPDADKARV